MKSVKKWLGASVIAALLVSATGLQATPRYVGGDGYQNSRKASALAPAIALGVVAAAAIIAVAVQKSHNVHGHCGR